MYVSMCTVLYNTKYITVKIPGNSDDIIGNLKKEKTMLRWFTTKSLRLRET